MPNITPGYKTRFAVGPLGGPADTQLDFVDLDFGTDEELIDANAMRGTRSRSLERTRTGRRRVDGRVRMYSTPVEMVTLLPWILGGTPSGNTYPLADALFGKYISIDRVEKVQHYDGVKVNRAVFRSGPGLPLELELDLMGLSEVENDTFPSGLSVDQTTSVFTFHDGGLTIGGTGYQMKSYELTIDNKIDGERFLSGSVYRTALFSMDREIMLRGDLPYGDAASLYSGAGTTGVAASIVFAFGNTSLTLAMAKVVYMKKKLAVPGRAELWYPFEGKAMKSGSTLELVTTLDSAP